MIEDCYRRAEKILTDNMDGLKVIAEALKERETIDAHEFYALLEGKTDVFEETDRKERERFEAAKEEVKETEEKLPQEDPIESKEE